MDVGLGMRRHSCRGGATESADSGPASHRSCEAIPRVVDAASLRHLEVGRSRRELERDHHSASSNFGFALQCIARCGHRVVHATGERRETACRSTAGGRDAHARRRREFRCAGFRLGLGAMLRRSLSARSRHCRRRYASGRGSTTGSLWVIRYSGDSCNRRRESAADLRGAIHLTSRLLRVTPPDLGQRFRAHARLRGVVGRSDAFR